MEGTRLNGETCKDNGTGQSFSNELAAVACSLLVFTVVNRSVSVIRSDWGWPYIIMFAGFVLACLVFRGPRTSQVSLPTSIILRLIALLLGAYALLSGITYPAGVSTHTDSLLFATNIVMLVGAIGAVAVFWYPAFVLLPCAAVLAQKMLASQLFGISISRTDYIPVVEMGLFLGISLCVLAPSRSYLPFRLGRMIAAADIKVTTTLLFLVAVGAHFANYFYSGLEKLALGGGPFLWVTTNPTEVLSLVSWHSGFLPTGHLAGVSLISIEAAGFLRPFINVSILLAQLGSVVFILRRRSMILATLFYDLTHVVIYLVSGIFFWKWILLNLGLVAAMRKLPRWVETPRPMLLAATMVLLAPIAFQIARLGWYDTPALTRSDLYAVTKDGRELQVPSNYFGTVSVTAAQHRLGRIAEGHYPTITWGSTQSGKVFLDALDDCSFGSDEPVQFGSDPDRVIRIVQLTHAYALQRAASDGHYRYDRFPHHIWSNPWLFDEFAALAPDEISHYLYRTVSGCVRPGPEGPVMEVQFRDEIEIPVATAFELSRSKDRSE